MNSRDLQSPPPKRPLFPPARPRRRRLARALSALVVAAAAAGCDVHGASEPGSPSTLQVSPASQTLSINGTQQFSAVTRDFDGVIIAGNPTWSVVSGGGTINAAGLFTAGTVPGTFASTVRATSGGLSGTSTVIVTAGPLATITVTPTPDTLTVNGARQFIAVGRDAGGNILPITPTWTVVNDGGSIVSTTGVFTAGTVAGTFGNTVRASVGTVNGTASVVVRPGALTSLLITPNPATLAITATQQFVVTGKDAAGNSVVVAPTWSVVNGGGTIGSTTGLFTAGTVPGTYTNTVRATVGALTTDATVMVTIGALSMIIVSPNPASLITRARQQFAATGRDIAGNPVPIIPVWSVVNGGGVIDSVSGLFTAGTTAGTFANTVVATVGTVSGPSTVIVTPIVGSIVVTPNPASLMVGGTQPFVAVVRDDQGNIITASPVWSVNSGGGTIDSTTGVFSAGTTTGVYLNTVRAAIGGISGTATVNLTAGPLASISVTPNPDTTMAFGTQQFVAAGRDANNNAVALTPVWSIENGGGAINAATGVFTAGSTAGTYVGTVRATSGAVSGSATVTVLASVIASITVTPNPDTTTAFGTQQFTAIARDANNNVVAFAPVWSVVNGGGVIDASTGIFTAGNVPGTYASTVRATAGAMTGSATVTVLASALASITVTPDPDTTAAYGMQQFVAIGRDANNNVVAFTPAWSVVNGGGVIGASTGMFTAGSLAGTYAGTVRATSGAITGNATVTVLPPVLASITVVPSSATIQTTASQQFVAIGRDTNGNPFAVTPVWSVVNGGGTISGTGLFTASDFPGTFAGTVQATSGSLSGNATVIVVAFAPPPLIDLGAAAPNGIMAGSAVTCVIGGLVNADVSVSPGNTLTGFGPCVITGTQNLANATAGQAQLALTSAYNALAALACPPANAIVANLGGTTKAAGVYCTASGIGVTGTLTLDGGGDPNANFVFQAGTDLTTAGNIVLINGAQAKNVYWLVGTSATIGTASQWQGNIIALTSITMVDNATLIGRALARNGAVTLGTNNVITLP